MDKRPIAFGLVFGFYPEVINRMGEERMILGQLSESYLYKDLFVMANSIKRPELLEKILQALAEILAIVPHLSLIRAV